MEDSSFSQIKEADVLPQFSVPSHDVIMRYWPPPEFERNTVAFDEDQQREVEEALVIQDAIFDLPPITNFETRDGIPYQNPPKIEFQGYIGLTYKQLLCQTLDDDVIICIPLCSVDWYIAWVF